MATYELDRALFDPRQLGIVAQVVNHLVATTQNGGHVDLPAGGLRESNPTHPARLGQRLGWPQQGLGGHAGIERALPADQLALDQRHGKTVIGQAPGAHLPGGTGAEDDHIEVFSAHEQLLDWLRDMRAVA